MMTEEEALCKKLVKLLLEDPYIREWYRENIGDIPDGTNERPVDP